MEQFTLTFDIESLRVIDQALQNVPYRHAVKVINEINRQIDVQNQLEMTENDHQ